jgi:hypothetical protein
MNTEKLILVYYLNLGNISPQKTEEIMSSFSANLNRSIREAHHILLPISNGDTRVECLNPKLITQEECRLVKSFLERSEDALSNFLEKTQKPIEETQKPTFLQKLIGFFKNIKS